MSKFIINIYECVDRVAMGSDMELNESQKKAFWAVADLVEHEAQKHPGDGNRMWEAVIEIDDLGLCLVTHTYDSPTCWVVKYQGQWLTYHELPGLYLDKKFYEGSEPVSKLDEINGIGQSKTCMFETEELARAALDTEEFRYLLSDGPEFNPDRKSEDFKIVKV